jgi:hypothetical protein
LGIVAKLKGEASHEPSIVYDTLAVADGLAWSARQMFAHYLTNETTVLTYLQPTANVRLMPYAPVAMIGVPITAVRYASLPKGETDQQWRVNPSRDFLAIPHELVLSLIFLDEIVKL